MHLGTIEQIFSSQNQIQIRFKVNGTYIFNFSSNEKEPLSLKINCAYDKEQLSQIGGVFSDKIYYLNAERIGPRNYQKMVSQDYVHCGYHGEATYYAINSMPRMYISEGRMFKQNNSQTTLLLEKQIEFWMNYIVPGVGLNFSQQDSDATYFL